MRTYCKEDNAQKGTRTCEYDMKEDMENTRVGWKHRQLKIAGFSENRKQRSHKLGKPKRQKAENFEFII